MPVSEGPTLDLRRTIVYVVVSLALGVGLLFVVVTLAGSGDVQFKLGDEVFEVGDAETFAQRIADDRAPLPFSSLSRNRPIYLQHIGDDPETGWFAVDARSPSAPAECVLEWDVDAQVFVDGCDAAATFPPDGEGLLRYTVTVDADGVVVVDLNAGDSDTGTATDDTGGSSDTATG